MHNELIQAVATVEASAGFRVLRRVPQALERTVSSDMDLGRMLVVDTETTGFDASKNKVIEIGALLVEYDKTSGQPVRVLGTLSALEDPGMPLSREVQLVTGLTDADLQGQRFDNAAVAALAEQADLVVCHNASFDRPFLEQRWPIFVGKPFGCSIAQLDWLEAGFSSAKLEMLILAHGHFYEAHRALSDCWALLFLLDQTLPDGRWVLRALLDDIVNEAWDLNLQVPYDLKDPLKAAARFDWIDNQPGYLPKSWLHHAKSREAMQLLLQTILAQVHRGKPFQCQLARVPPEIRFSAVVTPAFKPFTYPRPAS